MDCTVVSNTGTTVRRRNAGRTRNTRGNSIFTGAVRARSVGRPARLSDGSGELGGGLRQRRAERLRAREGCDGSSELGKVEPFVERGELVTPTGAEVDGSHQRADLVGERSGEPIGRPPEGERRRRDRPRTRPRADRAAGGSRRRPRPRRSAEPRGERSAAPATGQCGPPVAARPTPVRERASERIGELRRVTAMPAPRDETARAAQHRGDHGQRTSSRRRIHRNASPSSASPSPITTRPAGVRSAPSMSLRDVIHRNAKKPNGSTPRIVPDSRA